MRGLESGNDAFGSRKNLERFQSAFIGDGHVAGPAAVAKPGVLGANTRIIETGCDAMGLEDLPFPILKDAGAGSMEKPRSPAQKRSPVKPAVEALAK